ncbi:MAG: ATP-binding cassette domain-containing protein [Candidatus Caldarchaeales archaeon]
MLKVRDVFKRFGEKVAVDHVNFEVGGEVYSLLGPNGSGKTTLLSMIAGIITPDSGEISIDGLSPQSTNYKEMIGFSPQDPIVYENLTGLENMMFYARLYGLERGEARKRCRELLELVNLLDYGDKRVKTYSGGMKKRISFAISLIGEPEVLLLDEPTTGMDPQSRRDVWHLIKKLLDEGKTIVLATHYMEEADLLSNRVAIMDHGRIIVEDTPEGLKKKYGPSGVLLVELLEPVSKIDVKLERQMQVEKIILEKDLLKIYVEDLDEASPRILSSLIREGFKLNSLKIVRPTLEDVFLRLTGRRLESEI